MDKPIACITGCECNFNGTGEYGPSGRVLAAACKMEGPARRWWMSTFLRWRTEGQPLDWYVFKETFRDRCNNSIKQVEPNFLEILQFKGNFYMYLQEWTELYASLDPNDGEAVQHKLKQWFLGKLPKSSRICSNADTQATPQVVQVIEKPYTFDRLTSPLHPIETSGYKSIDWPPAAIMTGGSQSNTEQGHRHLAVTPRIHCFDRGGPQFPGLHTCPG